MINFQVLANLPQIFQLNFLSPIDPMWQRLGFAYCLQQVTHGDSHDGILIMYLWQDLATMDLFREMLTPNVTLRLAHTHICASPLN